MKHPANLSDDYLIGYRSKPVSRGPRGWVGTAWALLEVRWLKASVPFCRDATRRVVRQEDGEAS